jgi:hypothetical protein
MAAGRLQWWQRGIVGDGDIFVQSLLSKVLEIDKKSDILISRAIAYRDACCMAGSDTNVVQRHEVEN